MAQQAEGRSLRERIGMGVAAVDPAALIESLVEIEKAGVEQIWVGSPPWNPDLLTTLAAVAMRTTRLKLGTSILQIFARHPVLLAQQIASFAALAPGRLRLGLGTSSPEFAQSVYGVEMGQPLAYLREYIQVLSTLLQDGEIHHRGRSFIIDVARLAPARVPLLMATLGPAAFSLAGEIADGALSALCPLPYLLNTALPALSAGSAAVGRPRPPVIAHVLVAFTRDRATALQAGRQALRIFPTRSVYRKMFLAAGFAPQEIDTLADNFVESLLVFGAESQISERLLAVLNQGIDEISAEVLPIAEAVPEYIRLAQLIGQL